jgi:N-acetylmuramoyl-L-alanine amidase
LKVRLLSSPPLLATIALLVLAAAVPSSQPAGTPTLTLLGRDGRRSLPLTMVGDQEFIALDDLASTFQLAVREESQEAITVSYNGRTIVLTAVQSLASVSGRLISLPAPPTRSGRRWLVPVEFISRALSLIYDTRLDFRKPSRLLVVGDVRVPRITIRYDALGASARLTIDATPRTTSIISQENDRLIVKFDAEAIDVPSPMPPPGDQTLVRGVRVTDATTLAIDLGARFASMKAVTEPVDITTRLVIDLLAAQTETPVGGTPAPTAPELPPALAPPVSAIRTIAIDPGHGGADEGVHGAGGAREKDLALAVARRAKGVIEARLGIRVLLTRDDDRNISIDERTSIANNNKADLFVSLHANASFRKAASGLTIFAAAFDDTVAQEAAPLGGGERVPTFGGGLREIDLVVWDLAQTRHLEHSMAFAGILDQHFRERVPMAATPVGRAPLRVLKSANMPAVLIEMGYLSNPDQEKLMTADPFQTAFVQAFYDSIVRFRDSLPPHRPRLRDPPPAGAKSRRGCSTSPKTACISRASSAKSLTAKGRSSRRAKSWRRRSRPPASRSCRRFHPAPRSARCSSPRAARRSSI